MEKITEQDLKRPDVFVHTMDSFWKKLEPYKTGLIGFVAILFLAGAGYAAWEYIQGSREKKWSEELFLITSKIDKKQDELDKAFAEKNKPAKPEGGKKETKKETAPAEQVKNPEILEREFGPVLGELEAFVSAHSKDRQGLMGALEYSKIARSYQANSKAQAVLEKVSIQAQSEDPLTAIYFLHFGDLLSAQNGCESAQNMWRKVSFGPLKSEALLRDALCLETKGSPEKAEEIYRALEKDYKDSRAAQQAKKFLRTLKNKPRVS